MSDKTQQATVDVDDRPGGTATAIAPTRKPVPEKKPPKQLPPFRVLLHNDDVNTFEHVIESIVKLTPLTPQDAILRALEAHERKVSLLLVTHRERAELYVEQFTTFQITVTIEPAE